MTTQGQNAVRRSDDKNIILGIRDTGGRNTSMPLAGWPQARFFIFLAMPRGLWDLSFLNRDPGIELGPPTEVCGVLTTGPPGKPLRQTIYLLWTLLCRHDLTVFFCRRGKWPGHSERVVKVHFPCLVKTLCPVVGLPHIGYCDVNNWGKNAETARQERHLTTLGPTFAFSSDQHHTDFLIF